MPSPGVTTTQLPALRSSAPEVLSRLLPLLDDVDRADAHGELTGACAYLARQLRATLADLGVERFGEAGDPFDAAMHADVAASRGTQPAVGAGVFAVLVPGYRVGGVVLRPALVLTSPSSTPDGGLETGPVRDCGQFFSGRRPPDRSGTA